MTKEPMSRTINKDDPAQMCAVVRLLVTLRGVNGCEELTAEDVLFFGSFTGRTVQLCVRGIPFGEFVNPDDAR